MTSFRRIEFLEALGRAPVNRLSWLWLLAGALLLPFTAWQTVVPIAAWLAPVFLLRFARTSRRAWLARLLISLAYALGTMIASRGAPFNLLGFLGNVLFKGIASSLPYAVDRLLSRRLAGWARSLAFPAAFVAVDWGLSLLAVSSSGSPAYSQAANLALLQLLSVTGMWGITFLIMWFAAVVNELWERRFDWRSLRGLVGLYAGVLAAALLFGALRLNIAGPTSQAVEAATITLDTRTAKESIASVDWMTFGRSTDGERAALRPKLQAGVDRMLERTERALRAGARVVGWQESSAWVLQEDRQGVVDRAAELARRYDAYLQISLEVFTRTGRLPYLRNQSILVDPSGSLRWTYDKSHPVPFDEAFVTLSGPGKLPLVETPYGRFSTAICYDTYYPALIRQAGAGGADILLAPFNDIRPFAAYFLAIATYRAIENGFSMLRPTGNGISAIIDSRGRLLARQSYSADTIGIMIAELPTRGVPTIYSRIGDSFAYLCLAGLVVLAARAFVRRRMPASEKKRPRG